METEAAAPEAPEEAKADVVSPAKEVRKLSG